MKLDERITDRRDDRGDSGVLSRYPDRRAVTLPALHVVNRHLRHVPLQAVVEIAELLELAPAEVQDTLSFYGFFKQDQPHGETCEPGSVARSAVPCAAASRCWSMSASELGIQPGETTADGKLTLELPNAWGPASTPPACWPDDRSASRIWTNRRPTELRRGPATQIGIGRGKCLSFNRSCWPTLHKQDSHTSARLRGKR